MFRTILITALLLSSPLAAAETTVRLLHINDLHAHLVPHQDRVLDENGDLVIRERGGFARLATLLKQQREENPNAITMNVGDTFHGGVEALYSMGNAIVDPVNALGIDVGVAGNWDYAFSPGLTRMRFGPIDFFNLLPFMNSEAMKIGFPGYFMDEPFPVKRPNYPVLGANVRDIAIPWNFMPATHTREVNGVKVGFIGLTSDIVADMHFFMAFGFRFTEGEQAYRELLNKHAADLRASGADVVVVMSELGIHKDYKLANIIEAGSVDVFFSAHTHETTIEPLQSDSGALVVESGNDGWLGQMDVTVSDDGNITGMDWQLLAVDSSLADDANMQALVEEARAPYLEGDVKLIAPPFMMQKLKQPIDTVIGHTLNTVDRKDALESTFNAGWTDVIRQLTETDVAISPGFRMDTTFVEPGYLLEDNSVASGEITLEDAYRLFPVVYLMAKGEIDGAGLKTVLEQQLTRVFSSDVFSHSGGWNMGVSGLDITLDLDSVDGQRIKAISYSDTGEELQDNDQLNVGGCLRTIDSPDRLCSIKGFNKVRPVLNPADGQPLWTALDAFVYSLASNTFDGSRSSITDESNVARWPSDQLLQPIEGVSGETTPVDEAESSSSSFIQPLKGAGNTSEEEESGLAMLFYLPWIMLISILLIRRKSASRH